MRAARVPASSAKSITAFSFLKAENAIPVDSQATISGTAIQAFLPPGTDLTGLKAEFAASNKAMVTVGGRPQTSGVTANDFTAGATYQVMAEDGSTQNYTVSVVTDIAAFDAVVQAFMTAYAVPAVSIAATYGERLVYLKAYGLQDKEASQTGHHREPVPPGERFQADYRGGNHQARRAGQTTPLRPRFRRRRPVWGPPTGHSRTAPPSPTSP